MDTDLEGAPRPPQASSPAGEPVLRAALILLGLCMPAPAWPQAVKALPADSGLRIVTRTLEAHQDSAASGIRDSSQTRTMPLVVHLDATARRPGQKPKSLAQSQAQISHQGGASQGLPVGETAAFAAQFSHAGPRLAAQQPAALGRPQPAAAAPAAGADGRASAD